ncbi:lactosylceramide 4-alpha-galactosyltransferase-like [Fagus crenata]
MFDYKQLSRIAKSPIFSTLSFAAIFFFIYADSIVSNLSITTPFDLKSNEILEARETQKTESTLPLEPNNTVPLVPLVSTSTQENVVDEEETEDPLIPPDNVSREERLVWFRRKLPELEILQSNNLSQKFHGRVLEFFNHGCTVQFYMTWFSTAQSHGKREFLAMETLFKMHPQGCLVIISNTMDTKLGYSILKPILDRGFKVLAITPDPFLVMNTPAETWLEELRSGKKDPGYIPLFNNLSNLIRLAMLYKYGGIYLDTDLIILKDFSGLRNSVGAQNIDPVTKTWNRLNGAVMIFDINHPILLDFLEEFATTFNGNKWGFNGPYLVTRVIERVGDTPGYNLTILPPKAFYSVDWNKIHRLFRKPTNEVESRWVENMLAELNGGETYALHLWNKRSKE